MSDSGKREWRFYIDDMIGFAGKVLTYTDGLHQPEFEESGLTYDTALRNLEWNWMASFTAFSESASIRKLQEILQLLVLGDECKNRFG